MVTLTIAGEPRGKERPRFVRATGRTFTPSRTVSAEEAIRRAWMDAGQPRFPDGPLRMSITVRVQRPKYHYRADGVQLSAAGLWTPIPTTKPDLDNVQKLVSDALNRLAYRDDAQIAEGHQVREWAEWPETVVCIEAMEAVAEGFAEAV